MTNLDKRDNISLNKNVYSKINLNHSLKKEDFLRTFRIFNAEDKYKQPSETLTIQDSINKKRGELENNAREQDIKMKKWTLIVLFVFLAIETIAVFKIGFLQGYKNNFELDEWSFRLIIAATIGQITYMLRVAVQHLFPNSGK